MTGKISKLLLIVLLILPVQRIEAIRKCKKACTLIAKKCLIARRARICGTLRVGNLIIDNGSSGSGDGGGITVNGEPLISGIIPYSSGLITIGLGGTFPTGIPTTGLVMAFGSSTLQPVAVPATLSATDTGFAFTVPHDGTLHDLTVSVDSAYLAALTASPFTFTFTILVSPCTAGTTSAYTATALTASATTTPPATPIVLLTAGTTGCGSSSATINVSAGDRVVLLVTPNAPTGTTTLGNLGLSAGVAYTQV